MKTAPEIPNNRMRVEILVLMALALWTPPLGAVGAVFLADVVLVSTVSVGVRISVFEP